MHATAKIARQGYKLSNGFYYELIEKYDLYNYNHIYFPVINLFTIFYEAKYCDAISSNIADTIIKNSKLNRFYPSTMAKIQKLNDIGTYIETRLPDSDEQNIIDQRPNELELLQFINRWVEVNKNDEISNKEKLKLYQNMLIEYKTKFYNQDVTLRPGDQINILARRKK